MGRAEMRSPPQVITPPFARTSLVGAQRKKELEKKKAQPAQIGRWPHPMAPREILLKDWSSSQKVYLDCCNLRVTDANANMCHDIGNVLEVKWRESESRRTPVLVIGIVWQQN